MVIGKKAKVIPDDTTVTPTDEYKFKFTATDIITLDFGTKIKNNTVDVRKTIEILNLYRRNLCRGQTKNYSVMETLQFDEEKNAFTEAMVVSVTE